MDLRVTTQTQVTRSVADLQRLTTVRNRVTEQVTSGIKLSKPSDQPGNFVIVQNGKARQQRLDGFLQTISDSTATLNESVSILTEVHQSLSRASQLAQTGINGSADDKDFAALASEVDGIIDRALQLGNSEVNGRSLFGGTATDKQPFVVTATTSDGKPAAIAYQGADDRSRGMIGEGQSVDTLYAGNQVFQANGTDVFQTLIGLRDDLRSQALTGQQKADALTTRLSQLEKTRSSILGSVGEQSASLANLEALQNRTTELKLNSQTRTGELEATDYAEALVLIQQQESILQATSAVTSKLFEPGLLRFIQ